MSFPLARLISHTQWRTLVHQLTCQIQIWRDSVNAARINDQTSIPKSAYYWPTCRRRKDRRVHTWSAPWICVCFSLLGRIRKVATWRRPRRNLEGRRRQSWGVRNSVWGQWSSPWSIFFSPWDWSALTSLSQHRWRDLEQRNNEWHFLIASDAGGLKGRGK